MLRIELPTILSFAVTLGCSQTFEPPNRCPEGTQRSGNQCIPSSAPVLGCIDPFASNYSQRATVDDGSCTYSGIGCTDAEAKNYNPTATRDDGSCRFDGCTDQNAAVGFDPRATDDDGSCGYSATFAVDMNGAGAFDPADGVFVHGTFNDWCGKCAPLTDTDSDGIYRGSTPLTAGAHSYRFLIGSDPIFEEMVPDSCSVASPPARGLTMPAQTTTFDVRDFGRCPVTGLPLAVDDVFVPSGFMGDGELGGITTSEVCPVRGGDGAGLCHEFSYTPAANGWGGVFWQYPDGNWGPLPGFSVPQGATRVNFWAWGPVGGEVLKFLVGIQDADGFALETPEISLTTTPTEYRILLVGVDYDEIVGGFGWVASAPTGGGSLTFYVDDIQFKEVPSDRGGAGAGCTDDDANNYNPAATNDDGSCEYDVSFSVDMSCAGASFATVFVTGPFCSWCDAGFPLTDPDANGIYTGTFGFPSGPLEFKYMVDNFAAQEDLIDDVMAGNGACAPVTDGSTHANRQINVMDAPLSTSDTYGRCSACP